jgi:hypothetical protein
MPNPDAVAAVLFYFLLPLWVMAGVADWFCHRAAGIWQTSGPKESALHLLMLLEVGIPLAACLVLEINASVFALLIIAFLAHEATALWDVRYAVRRREVSPLEQHVHSFLELLPLMGGTLMALLYWSQFLALFGLGDEPARWRLEWKETPLPPAYTLTVLAAAVLLELVPYTEEWWRGRHGPAQTNGLNTRTRTPHIPMG